jgi:hypothetical protein
MKKDTKNGAHNHNLSEVRPEKFDHVLIFEEEFEALPNSLFIDEETNRLFLCDAVYGTPHKIVSDEKSIPLNEASLTDFKEVSIKQALEWFVKCDAHSRGSSGTIATVCALAAKAMNGEERIRTSETSDGFAPPPKAYEEFGKVVGLYNYRGWFEAVGFNKKGVLCHLTLKGEKPISLEESVKRLAKMEDKFIVHAFEMNSEEDDAPRRRWFKMLEKALKK